MIITYRKDYIPNIKQLGQLYDAVGWINYTSDLERLERAMNHSKYLLTAWKESTLVGLLRAVGDGETIMYVQDLLILPEFHDHRIGHQLMEQFMKDFSTVRQKVLMTDQTQKTVHFYESCGFVAAEKYDGVAYVHYTI